MTDRKIAKYNFEMAEHANGAAQYLGALLGGRYVTKEQTRDLIDFLFVSTYIGCYTCYLLINWKNGHKSVNMYWKIGQKCLSLHWKIGQRYA